MPEREEKDEAQSTPPVEEDAGMAALDELTRRLLTIPKEELDRRVAEDLTANRGKRRAF